MAQRAAYLVKAHNILATMMLNNDQTGIHIVPSCGARTWAEKGSKHVLVHGLEDERQITCTVLLQLQENFYLSNSFLQGALIDVYLQGTKDAKELKMRDGI
jgi:hypothetical protein